jgi:hypothetical protein
VRPDLPQPTHWLEEEETLRSILFLVYTPRYKEEKMGRKKN